MFLLPPARGEQTRLEKRKPRLVGVVVRAEGPDGAAASTALPQPHGARSVDMQVSDDHFKSLASVAHQLCTKGQALVHAQLLVLNVAMDQTLLPFW